MNIDATTNTNVPCINPTGLDPYARPTRYVPMFWERAGDSLAAGWGWYAGTPNATIEECNADYARRAVKYGATRMDIATIQGEAACSSPGCHKPVSAVGGTLCSGCDQLRADREAEAEALAETVVRLGQGDYERRITGQDILGEGTPNV